MKAITWLATFTVGASAFTSTSFATAPQGWITDLEKAFQKAKIEKKAVLVEFTGSDWCPPCVVMRKNVFATKEFVNEASKHFILVELDFPNADPAMQEKNKPLAMKYNVEGFPTTLLFNAQGQEFSRFFSVDFPETDLILKHLSRALERKDLD